VNIENRLAETLSNGSYICSKISSVTIFKYSNPLVNVQYYANTVGPLASHIQSLKIAK